MEGGVGLVPGVDVAVGEPIKPLDCEPGAFSWC